MQKISSTHELQKELRILLAESEGHLVSREDMAAKLRTLAARVAGDSAGDAKEMKTPDLYKKTVELLKGKKFGPARAFLDELSQRKDNKKELPSAKSLGLSGPYAQILEDRIDLVNSKTASNPAAKYEI